MEAAPVTERPLSGRRTCDPEANSGGQDRCDWNRPRSMRSCRQCEDDKMASLHRRLIVSAAAVDLPRWAFCRHAFEQNLASVRVVVNVIPHAGF